MTKQVQDLSAQMQQVIELLKPPAPAPPAQAPSQPMEFRPASQPEPRLPSIERYDGDPSTCRSFLSLCTMTFELQPSSYPSESPRVAFMITHLTGRAREWATAEWDKQSSMCHSVKDFSEALRKVFDHCAPGGEAARRLLTLRQGNSRVADHAIRFRTLAAESEWGENSFSDTFLHSLSEDIKDHLAPLDLPPDFDSLVALAIKIDNRLQERKMEKSRSVQRPSSRWEQLSSAPLPVLPPGPASLEDGATGPSRRQEEEPMQLGRTRLTSEERQRRFKEGRCLYCGKIGHLLASCPAKDQAHQ